MRLFDVKLYEPKTERSLRSAEVKVTWEEVETLRGLTETQKIPLVSYLERMNIKNLVKKVKTPKATYLYVHRCHKCGKPIVEEPTNLRTIDDITILCSSCAPKKEDP